MRQKIKDYTLYLLFALALLCSAYLFYKYVLNIIAPFLIAYLLAFVIRAASDKFIGKTKIPKGAVRVLIAILFFALLLFAISFSLYKLLDEAISILSNISKDDISNLLIILSDPINKIFGEETIAKELSTKISDWLYSSLSTALSGFVSRIGNTALYIPKLLLSIFVTLISTVYFAVDLERINGFIKDVLPKSLSTWLLKIKSRFKSVGVKYIKAYLLIMLMVFGIMFFGLTVIGVEYSLLIALILALLDMLPLIGVGTVMIPWSVICMLFGDLRVGISLIVLFAVCEIIRQIIEPRIVGKNLGLPPLVTLVLMYVGLSVFGILGILLTPIFTVIFEVLINKDYTTKIV